MSWASTPYLQPQEVVDRYGADAVRMYMLNSGVVRAEPLKFKEILYIMA